MNIFDIIGPVMIGPSSSHTAGVVRIGNVAKKILGAAPDTIHIQFHGSFAKTYKGHGSDRAIIGGLMGFQTFDERIKDSLSIAKEKGIQYSFDTVELANAHPNTIIIEAQAGDTRLYLLGVSVGGGNIVIQRINDVDVEFDGQYDTLVVSHTDTPGAIALVTNILSVERINIAKMKVYRSRKGGDAIMVIETDDRLDKKIAGILEHLPHINRATVIKGLH